ncbi:16S rRNA (guanine(966)-N(2))-methyltransferase RsmD [Vibrio sp. SS-MA-C1-2]|uniref:16S rRNA (guanine(966)-N(2))-methyltransferase RsmD n=1 Tax=Vibrio sp. SS-MA-C1-2 TaxID=2908646 RepID=UPI001F1BEAF0|nr:16S rRNA (guanine(966)-N(2))-methyltransferase RsmD [Vibrio sp. SS-MA-C1-2]UJF19298.1 16S rRNA (guanine(966)-N(2))-methyltransferase RsmD [Vibrio sp. SS-MA-C1-2]
MGQIRIISGQWRGRKLPVHDAQGLRPTTDRVKETLFNWLAPDIRGARCLDLFAGSGGLGFEALSRFADSVTFIEKDKQAANQLRSNAAALKSTAAEIIHTDTLALLSQPCSNPYDIIFIDPPFRKDLLDQVIELLEKNHYLSQDTLIYIEAEKELGEIITPPSWHCYREKSAGQVAFRLYQKEEL